MKKLTTLILSLLFVSLSFAQSNSITYKFSVEGCGDIPELEIFRGIMFEGDNIEFEPYTFPQGNPESQFFYDLMVGGNLGFPLNSLNENISINIVLKGLCDLDLANLPTNEEILELLFLEITVNGAASGVHAENEYYNLANGQEAYLKLPASKIIPFLNFLRYSIDDFTPFYVDQNSEVDLNGIRKVVDNNFVSIYLQHFSTIGVGFKVEVVDTTDDDDSDSTDTTDTTDTTTDVDVISNTPNVYNLGQNYPNPFNPSTTISYTLPQSGFTKLSVYNSLGEVIQTLVNENQSAGKYNINFNASNLTSGMYFYTISSGNFTQTNKMILMK
ncbi:MAG: T9SS type A sorting domain-containing protein [Ignavibacteriae bacterium]|nr:T9SS type A sorting domain-containing protein [Ignavibacteriota bacterium]